MHLHANYTKLIKATIYISVFATATLSLVSCKLPPKENPALENSVVPPLPQATQVSFMIVEPGNFTYRIESNGKLIAAFKQKVIAENRGIIKTCIARNGLRVSKGQVIVRYDTDALELQLEKARQQAMTAKAEYESILLGYESLLNDKTTDEAEAIRQKLKANSGLSAAEIEVRVAELELKKAVIQSPINGTLANVKVRQSMHVNAGDELFTIYSHQDILCKTNLLESDRALIQKGTPATIKPVGGTKIYAAVVSEVNPMVDENGLVMVKLTIRDPQGLVPGRNVQVTINFPARKTLIIPKEAVVRRSGRPVVFTLENGLAKWNYVTTGMDNGQETEITEGIDAGDTVITSGNLQLAHDAPVSPLKSDTL